MKNYKVYLFDFDYTLADSGKAIVMCFRHVLDKHGYMAVSDEDIKRTIGKTLEESFEILTGVGDMDVLLEWKREYVEKADVCMTENTTLFPETLDVLGKLKEKGIKIGIISTKYRYRIESILKYSGAEDGLIDLIIGGEDVTVAKPAPEGVFAALDVFGCQKDEVLYLGDSIVDAETARNAGVDYFAVLHGTTTRNEVEMYPNVGISEDLRVLCKDRLGF